LDSLFGPFLTPSHRIASPLFSVFHVVGNLSQVLATSFEISHFALIKTDLIKACRVAFKYSKDLDESQVLELEHPHYIPHEND